MVSHEELLNVGFTDLGSGSYQDALKYASKHLPKEVRIIRDTEMEDTFDAPHRFHLYIRK